MPALHIPSWLVTVEASQSTTQWGQTDVENKKTEEHARTEIFAFPRMDPNKLYMTVWSECRSAGLTVSVSLGSHIVVSAIYAWVYACT